MRNTRNAPPMAQHVENLEKQLAVEIDRVGALQAANKDLRARLAAAFKSR
jgi:hypothetical protein